MYQIKRVVAWAGVLGCVVLFAGCGGGGGGSKSSRPPPPPTTPLAFTVGGTISGLAGNSVALRLNGGADLVVAANGAYTFPNSISSGAAYAVTVQTQPSSPAQTCVLANATGKALANVTDVTVTCSINSYHVGGTVSGLATGSSVVLRNNGGDDLTVSSNGTFQFATSVASGGAYGVTVQSQPAGSATICSIANGSGTVSEADVTTVAVNCATPGYSVGGTVTGLSGPGLILRNNGGDDLAVNANGAFTFSSRLASGAHYSVAVSSQPPAKLCTVTNGTGTIASADVSTVSVTCVDTYTIGGEVKGLDVPGLVLRNAGADDLTVNANGAFTFATRVPKNMSYNVSAVTGTPASPRHVCQVTNATGTATANVTNVVVTCEADRFAYVAHYSTTGFMVHDERGN